MNNLTHRKAIWLALFVTFLWSTSWVLIKIGLKGIPPLTFAGLRYMLAFLILLPFFIRQSGWKTLSSLDARAWGGLVVLGIFFYPLAQGGQYISMSFLPAVTVNLILGFNPVVVTFLGIWLLAEVPNRIQWLGVVAAMGGVAAYFYPVQFPRGEVLGLSAGVICMLATAYSSILGRAENRRGVLSPLAVTVISMGVGAPLMLVSGLVSETWVPISLESWAIILYLAVVNTALAFTWWNLTLRTLPAMESSMVNNAMTIQVPVIAFLFLNETMGLRQIMGLALIAVGVMAVQIGKMPRMQHQTQQQP